MTIRKLFSACGFCKCGEKTAHHGDTETRRGAFGDVVLCDIGFKFFALEHLRFWLNSRVERASASPCLRGEFFLWLRLRRARLRCATLAVLSLLLVASGILLADAPMTAPAAYFNDFEHAAKGKPSDEFQILNGDFVVRAEGGNSFLELPGDPLDTFGLLFGPGESATLDVSARIWADQTAQRYPEFGIGSNDTNGYKLWLWPAHGKIELRKADDAVASTPFNWKPARWLRLRLRVWQVSPKLWRVEAKAWPDGTSEPGNWLLNFNDTEEPTAGKASIWGVPFSGKPIRFDDLSSKPAP
jgi:hypothetical protein